MFSAYTAIFFPSGYSLAGQPGPGWWFVGCVRGGCSLIAEWQCWLNGSALRSGGLLPLILMRRKNFQVPQNCLRNTKTRLS
jgi:hypothetical protein